MKCTTEDYLCFDDRLFRLVGIPAVALIIPPVFFGQPEFGLSSFLQSLIYTLFVWEGNRFIFIYASRKYPDLRLWKKRLRLVFLFCFSYTAVSCTLAGILIYALFPALGLTVIEPNFAASYGASYLLLLAFGAVYESIRYFTLWKTALEAKEHLEQVHLASQLEGLRNQVNPHFLFNSLNTLTWLISENQDKAIHFVQKLSKVYRYVLESRESTLVSLEEERTFLDAYLYLLKERFGENLRINLDRFPVLTAWQIVPLSLQLLVENAIKHNIVSSEHPLHLELFEEGTFLIVRNNLQKKLQVQESTGVGLANIRQRYKMINNLEVEIQMSDTHYAVHLPLIPKYNIESYERFDH
ncbi:MAG: histidine kinase [Saprospiraceae bacterium]|nr:histidine kinase [Saprospiraceae bacterium]